MPFHTDTSQVRGNALDFVGFPESAFRRPTFARVMTSQWLNDAPSGSPLRIITEIESSLPICQRKTSAEADLQEAQRPWCSSPTPFLPSERQVCSPVPMGCDGWCGYDLIPRANVVSVICAWRNDGQRLMTLSRLRPTGSCLYLHVRTSSARGKAQEVRSLRCCVASSVSAPCSNMAIFVLRT